MKGCVSVTDQELYLSKIVDHCKEHCKQLGLKTGNVIQISINSRLKVGAGKCLRHKVENKYKLEFAPFVLKQSQVFIESTVMHELLHTIPGGFDHGHTWQCAAAEVNKANGYHVSTCYSQESLTDTSHKPRAKYTVTCTTCNRETGKQRASGITKNPELYYCTRCKGRTLQVKQNY